MGLVYNYFKSLIDADRDSVITECISYSRQHGVMSFTYEAIPKNSNSKNRSIMRPKWITMDCIQVI